MKNGQIEPDRRCWQHTSLLVLGLWLLCSAPAFAQEHSQRNELGINLARQGHLDDALRQFVIILTTHPTDTAALNNVANIYAMTGRAEQARHSYEQALIQEPDDGGIDLNLALVLHALQLNDESSRSMQAGLRKIGDIEQAYFMLGLSTIANGGQGRASETTTLSDAEIEALLASALDAVTTSTTAEADVSQKAPAPTTAAETPKIAGTEIDSYHSGTKAGTDENTNRYYWKSDLGSH